VRLGRNVAASFQNMRNTATFGFVERNEKERLGWYRKPLPRLKP
jgi:hypothetical protein